MNVIHQCNIHCYSQAPDKLESMAMKDIDRGKWLPFAFHMDIVVACKMTTDDEEEMTYMCTTIFTESQEIYLIDTPYSVFLAKFTEYNQGINEEENDNNINL